MDRNGYGSKRSFVNPDGTVEKARPRPIPVQRSAAAPTGRGGNGSGAAVPRRPAPPRTPAPRQQSRQNNSKAPRNTAQQRPAQQRAPQQRPTQQKSAQQRAPQQRPAQQKSAQQRAPQQRPIQQRPAQQRAPQQRPAQQRAAQTHSKGWAMPEGSPVYTANGRMYEAQPSYGRGGYQGQRSAGAPPRSRQRPQSYPGRGGRAPAKSAKKKKKASFARAMLVVRAFALRLLVIFLLCTVLGFWRYRAVYYSEAGEGGGSITYSIDDGSGDLFEAPTASAWYNGVMYVNFSALYKSLNMAAVGSLDSMRFIVKDDSVRDSAGDGSEQYVIFTDGSRIASVNGTAAVMEARCRVIGKDIWVPLSFVENYMDGVDVDRRSDDRVVFASSDKTAAEKANKEKDPKDRKKINASDYPIRVGFRLHRFTALEPVPYPG